MQNGNLTKEKGGRLCSVAVLVFSCQCESVGRTFQPPAFSVTSASSKVGAEPFLVKLEAKNTPTASLHHKIRVPRQQAPENLMASTFKHWDDSDTQPPDSILRSAILRPELVVAIFTPRSYRASSRSKCSKRCLGKRGVGGKHMYKFQTASNSLRRRSTLWHASTG